MLVHGVWFWDLVLLFADVLVVGSDELCNAED